MSDIFQPPMFPPIVTIPLAVLPTPGSTGLEKDIRDAVAGLNLKAGEFSSSKSFSKDYLDLIGQVETQLTNGDLPEATKIVWQATFLLNRALDSSRVTKFRTWMCVYYGLWLLLLVAIGSLLKEFGGGGHSAVYFGSAYWRYVLMGALGGLTIAVWGLIEHSSNLDFDRAFADWYWLKPLLGAVMGLVAVLAVMAGLIAIEGNKPQSQSEGALYVIAFLGGFSERFFIRIIDKLMTALLGGEQSSSSSSKPTN